MVRSHYWKMRQSWSVTNWNDLKNQNLSLTKINHDFSFLYLFLLTNLHLTRFRLTYDRFLWHWLAGKVNFKFAKKKISFSFYFILTANYLCSDYLISNANLFKQIFLVLELNLPHFFTFLYKKLQFVRLLATPSYW